MDYFFPFTSLHVEALYIYYTKSGKMSSQMVRNQRSEVRISGKSLETGGGICGSGRGGGGGGGGGGAAVGRELAVK